MGSASFTDELARFGPEPQAAPLSVAQSREYCRRLARSHYENFTVASWLLPAELRPHFYHVYAYCRWADDLADETSDPAQSLALLDWWEHELDACYAGKARHPVFQALRETIDAFAIPRRPFADLLIAFRQDQTVHRYDDFDQLLGYCRNSADPVGRLVLYLARSFDDERAELSDRICTGLQLANFWQDVACDYGRGRIYLPRETYARFGYDESQFAARRCNQAFRDALRFEVDRAEQFLHAGLPLVERMPRRLRGDIWLFAQGGLKILAHIRRLDYDVWNQRPTVSKAEQVGLLLGFLWQRFTPFRSTAR